MIGARRGLDQGTRPAVVGYPSFHTRKISRPDRGLGLDRAQETLRSNSEKNKTSHFQQLEAVAFGTAPAKTIRTAQVSAKNQARIKNTDSNSLRLRIKTKPALPLSESHHNSTRRPISKPSACAGELPSLTFLDPLGKLPNSPHFNCAEDVMVKPKHPKLGAPTDGDPPPLLLVILTRKLQRCSN
ncbi:hypothetical protein NDU88_007942 [Pleurodeles waltl]|uniref:Uncharacterized protein n=1 Tax=Pleurodeles waltl TaxID=8319 RepID=A0AAV7QMB4_PLEWA|nr:hypothetical protein NDU88_007942 [Pleurodeles waltl]